MTNLVIRERNLGDVNEFCKFLTKLDNEAEFMLFEKGERKISNEKTFNNIEAVINNGDICYIAVMDDKIIGYIIAVRDKFIRTRHIANVVIGILEEYCNKGIGYALFQEIFNWAKISNIKKLELTVITENKRAVSLYNKLGFETEGIRKKSTFINGKYFDDFYMAKIIEME